MNFFAAVASNRINLNANIRLNPFGLSLQQAQEGFAPRLPRAPIPVLSSKEQKIMGDLAKVINDVNASLALRREKVTEYEQRLFDACKSGQFSNLPESMRALAARDGVVLDYDPRYLKFYSKLYNFEAIEKPAEDLETFLKRIQNKIEDRKFMRRELANFIKNKKTEPDSREVIKDLYVGLLGEACRDKPTEDFKAAIGREAKNDGIDLVVNFVNLGIYITVELADKQQEIIT